MYIQNDAAKQPESQKNTKETNPQPRNKSKNKLYNPLWCIAFCFILFSHILYIYAHRSPNDPHMENTQLRPFKYSPSSFYSFLHTKMQSRHTDTNSDSDSDADSFSALVDLV